jgi:hypothetical protein
MNPLLRKYQKNGFARNFSILDKKQHVETKFADGVQSSEIISFGIEKDVACWSPLDKYRLKKCVTKLWYPHFRQTRITRMKTLMMEIVKASLIISINIKIE